MVLFNKPQVDLILKQVPTLVSDSYVYPERDDLDLEAVVVVKSTQKLSKESVKVTFRCERATPGLSAAIFSIAGSDIAKDTLYSETKCAALVHNTSRSTTNTNTNELTYEAPVSFTIPHNAPGSLCPLTSTSSSIRYFLTAEFSTSKFSRATTCSKELHFFRACRDDARDLDTFVEHEGVHADALKYDVRSMKAVACGGQARFQVTLTPMRAMVRVPRVAVTLKERQVVRKLVPAAYQQRPGETTDLESTFELVSRVVKLDVPRGEDDNGHDEEIDAAPSKLDDDTNARKILFDLSLPQSTQAFRRSSATKGGIKLDHFFELKFEVEHASRRIEPFMVRCNTALVLPTDYENYKPDLGPIDTAAPKEVAVAPPAYGEFAPPSYGDHKIDALYNGGETVRTNSVSDVAVG